VSATEKRTLYARAGASGGGRAGGGGGRGGSGGSAGGGSEGGGTEGGGVEGGSGDEGGGGDEGGTQQESISVSAHVHPAHLLFIMLAVTSLPVGHRCPMVAHASFG